MGEDARQADWRSEDEDSSSPLRLVRGRGRGKRKLNIVDLVFT